ncbi:MULTISPECIES: D-arabinono-1,4-lactone oxidase [unclassified Microbacterium]|uniref:D-arabinono-1,4-lactone oxidase n=1 Tax=unclassified Microbacterium TaxID=2609290 RepID=UPI00214B1D54|nr:MULTISPECIES: D-arabinono-1,4-lactone oxidase [unclassified Microbacterium]MCR2783438.1 FAD-binding protein [Microbacterium sp. zg.B96]WIM15694.1 FAD-binding protein [Microbacterium sp. zg-B96]
MPRNWAGTYTYRAPRIEAAGTIDDVRRLVAAGGRVHALGTRHSFTDLPDTDGTLIDVTGIDPAFHLDVEDRAVTVGAGTRYGELALWLEERGWALGNLGSLPHINVGGATATGTHGSGDRNGVLSAAVRALRYVGADGDLHEVRRGDPDFPALAVGLGAFGILVSLTLDVQPTFRVRQDIYTGITWDAALAGYDELTSAGYSVSLFSLWEPGSIGYAWVKTRLDADDDPVPDTLLDGVRATGGESPLSEADNVTELAGVPGPWLQRLPHFRLDAEPSFGDEIQSEYFVDRADAAAALTAVRQLGDGIRPHLIVTELRTAAADELWLSPAYRRDVAIIHFTWHNHPDGVAAMLPPIEAALAPFHARPHWGKAHRFDRAAMQRVHPRLADARAVFERLDPDGRFVNDHLVRVGVREPR